MVAFFFQIFVYGDVVYTQTWEVLTLKNCIESPYVKNFLSASVQLDVIGLSLLTCLEATKSVLLRVFIPIERVC